MVGTSGTGHTAAAEKKPFYRVLYVQVLFAIVLGAIIGGAWPELAVNPWFDALGQGLSRRHHRQRQLDRLARQ